MQRPDLVITARGDPLVRTTWSGTPRALVTAFRDLGLTVATGSCDADGLAWKLAAYAWRRGTFRGSTARFGSYLWPRAQHSQSRMGRLRALYPNAWFLHTDTMWLPYTGLGSRDVLFRDDTFANHAEAWGIPPRMRAHLDAVHCAIYHSAGHIFAVSAACRDDLISRYAVAPSDVTVVGTGTGVASPAAAPDRNFSSGETLFVGKVRFRQKGGPLLLDAFRRAHATAPNLSLTMVVPVGVRVNQPGVTVLHDVSWGELQKLYRRAALFAMPALYEPWGLVYLEAQQHGMPVLGLRRKALPELCDNGRTGFLCQDATPDAVASALLDAHRDPDRLSRMGRNAHAFARGFTWQRTVQTIADQLSLQPGAVRG